MNCSSHLKSCLNPKWVNFVVRELYLNKAVIEKKETKTYLKAFSVVLGSNFVLILEGEEQMVFYKVPSDVYGF